MTFWEFFAYFVGSTVLLWALLNMGFVLSLAAWAVVGVIGLVGRGIMNAVWGRGPGDQGECEEHDDEGFPDEEPDLAP